MDNLFLSSAEVTERSRQIGIKKANNKARTTRSLAFMAGMFIALGGITNTVVNIVLSPGIGPFLGAFMFALGLMLVLVAGGELFTGNILLYGAYLSKDISLKQLATNWGRVYLWNFIGALCFSAVTHLTKLNPAIVESITATSAGKLELTILQCLAGGFLCNILVCLGVWVSFSANDGASKFVLMAMPIIAFILLKYEHSVANMFYFSFTAIESGIDFVGVLKNMIPVTVGNILGGMFIAFIYHHAHHK